MDSAHSTRAFWIWVDPQSRHVRRLLAGEGSFASAGRIGDVPPAPPFVPNPRFVGRLSPFALNVLHEYAVEYALEQVRSRGFVHCPSRLTAIFLLPSERAAHRYAERHPGQVAGRSLLRVRTVGECRCSEHDSRWIDALRSVDLEGDERDQAALRYWSGDHADRQLLSRLGLPADGDPILEVLLLGELALVPG